MAEYPDQYEAFRASSMDNMEACTTCGRTFVPEVLEKHGRICRKNAQKKRKVFDSGRMRAQGTDIPVNKTLRTQPFGTQPKTKNDVSKQTNPVKQSKWRQQHEEFIRSIRAAKETDVAIKTGKPLPPPPPPVVNPDYVQCPHCERRFNEAAAERHIPKCGDMKKRMPNKNVADAKARTNARTQYRAPLPGKKKPAAANSTSRMTSTANSAQSRGVSSGYGQQASSGYGMQNGSKKMTGGSTLTNGSSPSSARSTGYRGAAQSGYQGPAAGGKGRSQYSYQNYDNDSDDDGYDNRQESPYDHGRGAMLRTGRVNNSPPVRQANQRPANRSSPANAARSSLASQTENPASKPARNDTHSQSVSVDDSNKPASQSGSAALSQQARKSGRTTPILTPTFKKPLVAQKGREVKSPSPTERTPSPKGADIAFPRLISPNPDEDVDEDPLASSSKFISLTSEEGELSHPVPLLPKLDLSGLKTPPRTPRKGRPSLPTKKGKSRDQPPKIAKPLLTTRGEEVVNLQSTKKRFSQATKKSPMRPQPLNSKLSPSQKESDSDHSCPTQLAPRGTKEKAVLAITPPSTPMAPKGNKEKAVIAITPPSTPMAPRGTKEKAVLAITPPSTPMAPRACLIPLATRACPTPLAPAPRACLTPLSPRASPTPLSPRASLTPLSPRECPTPLAPRGNSVVTPPNKIRPVSQIDQEVPSPTPAIKKPLLTPRGNIKAQTVINRTATTQHKQKRYFSEQPKVQCPTCPLKLIPRAAERHIPYCEEKHLRLGMKKTPAKAERKAKTKVVAVHVDKQPNIGQAEPKPHSMALSLAEEGEKEEHVETTKLKNSRFTQSSVVESQAGTMERKQKRYFTEQPKVQCPHCLIKIVPGSAERHISFCEEKHRRLGEKKPPAKAKRMVETKVSKGKAKVVAALHLDDQLNSGQAAPKLHSMALCLDEEGEKEKDAATNKLKNSRVTSWSAEENKAGITEPKQKRYFSEQVRVQCPYCPIKMLPEVAKRHIAFCEEKHRRLGEKKTPAKAKKTAEANVSKGKAKVVPAKPKPYSVALCLEEEGEQDKDGDAAKVKKSRATSRSVVESEASTTGYKQKRYYTEQPRVQCPHCPIKLKETSLPEHVKFCAEVHARLENKNRGKTKKQTKKGLNKTAILQELTEEPCSQKRYNPPWGPNYVYCPYCFLKIDAMSAREHIPSCRADQEERLAEKKIPANVEAKPKLSKEMEAIAPCGRSKKTKSASRIPIPIRKPLLTARSNILKAPKGKKLCLSPLKSNIPPAEGDAQGLLSMQKSNAAEKETSHEPFVSKATVATISCSTNGKGKRELPIKQADTVQKNLLATANIEDESLTSPSDNMKPEAAVSTLSCSTSGTGKRELPTQQADTVDKDLDTTARVDGQPNSGQAKDGERERESDGEAAKVQKSLISQRSLEENKGGTTDYKQKQCYSEQPRVECPHCHIKVKEGSLPGHMMFCGDVHFRLENKNRGKTEKQAKKALSEAVHVIRQQLEQEPGKQKHQNSPSDYIQCPQCSLKMNAMLAIEHIPFCDGVQHRRLGEKKTEASTEGTVAAETKISKGKKQDGYKKEAIAPPWTLASPKHNRGRTLPNKTRPSSRIPITIRKSLLTPRSNIFMAQTGKKVSASALTSNAPQPPADGGHRMLMMQKSNSGKKEISRAHSENIKAKAVTTLICSANGKGKRELPTHQHDTVQEDLNTTPHIGAKAVAVCVDDQPNSGQAKFGEAAALSKNSQIPVPRRSVDGDKAGTTRYKQNRWSTYQPKVQCPHCPTRVKEALLPWHLESCAGVYALQEIKNREKTKKQAKKALSETAMRQHLTQEPSKKRHHSLPSDPIVKYGFIYDCHGQLRPGYRKSTEHVKASTGYLSSPLEMEMDSPWPRGDSPLSAYSRLPEIPSARDSLSTLTPEIPSEREETAITFKQRIEAFGNRPPPTYGFPWPECERLLLTTRLPAIPEEREEPDGTLTQGPETRERGLPTPIEEIPLSERLDLHYTQCPNCLIKMTVISAIDHIPSCTPRRLEQETENPGNRESDLCHMSESWPCCELSGTKSVTPK